MSVSASVKYIRLAGASVAKPVSVRVSGAWHVVQSVPAAPTNVFASPGLSSADISWVAPANTGNIPLTGFTVTASPGGATATALGTDINASVNGLTNGTTYTFTVKATNAIGNSVSSAASNSATPSATITGKMYLAPASGSYASGATISVDIHVDSMGTPVNAVEADLTYDSARLTYVSTDTTGSPFPTTLQSTGGSGSVKLSVGSLSTDPTGDNVIATVTFNYLASGTAAVTVAGSSAVYRTSDSSNILNSTAGASYTLT